MTWGRTNPSMKRLMRRGPMTVCNLSYTYSSMVIVSFFCTGHPPRFIRSLVVPGGDPVEVELPRDYELSGMNNGMRSQDHRIALPTL